MWATLTGAYSIHAPPRSEFRGVGSVERSLNKKVKKIMAEAKTLAAKNGIAFKRETDERGCGIQYFQVGPRGR